MAEKMTVHRACEIVESFDGANYPEEQVLQAWQWLIDTGLAWRLQGWYGRTASALLADGILERK